MTDSYGVYAHIPFCKSKCNYCAFVSTPDQSLQKDYVDALTAEIVARGKGENVDTVYIGGGTPSALFRGALKRILSAVRASFSVAPNAEITVEANPESCSESFVAECGECGVNRVSMGLQSSDPNVLRCAGRIHTAEDFINAAKRLRKAGICNISSDLILGLPKQGLGDVEKSIGIMSELCTHASVYAFTLEENTPFYRMNVVPDDDKIADFYDAARSLLESNGFRRYEVSNFARGVESRHNRKYWRCEPYIGFGAAAHGYDGGRMRYRHSDDIAEYIAKREIFYERLSDRDIYNEYVMLALRTEEGIDCDRFFAKFGYRLEERAAEKLGELIKRGYIDMRGGKIAVAPKYMFVMNGIIEELMSD